MHDIEQMRSAAGLTSSLAFYFINDSLNRHVGFSACMEAIAEKVGNPAGNELSSHSGRSSEAV
jgi:phosphatidylinositol 4-kinase A